MTEDTDINKRMIRCWPEQAANTNGEIYCHPLIQTKRKATVSYRIIVKYIIPNYKENEANKYKKIF